MSVDLTSELKELAQSVHEYERPNVVESDEAYRRFRDDLDNRREGKVVGMPLPPEWSVLERRIGPLEPASLTIVTARTRVGKTIWAMQLARYLAGEGKRVMYVSRELSVVRLIRRHICSYGADMLRLRTGHPNDADLKAMGSYLAESENWKLFYDEESRTMEDVQRRIEYHEPDIVFIDYLQRFRYDTEKEYAAITRIANELQDVALITGLPVVCLSQLSRPQKGDEWKPPSIHDTRGSGAVEERATNLIILHRKWETAEEEVRGTTYTVGKAMSNEGFFIIAKASDSETGNPIAVQFDGARMRIREML